MASIKVTQKRNNSTEIVISGELTIFSVMDVYQQYFKELVFKELVTLKLAKIEEIDTAGFQLIYSLLKTITEQKLTFQIASVSQPVLEFCELFNNTLMLNKDVQSSMGGT